MPSTFLLMGLPFRDLLIREIPHAASTSDDDGLTRRGAVNLSMTMTADCGEHASVVRGWLDADDIDVRLTGVRHLAHSGVLELEPHRRTVRVLLGAPRGGRRVAPPAREGDLQCFVAR